MIRSLKLAVPVLALTMGLSIAATAEPVEAQCPPVCAPSVIAPSVLTNPVGTAFTMWNLMCNYLSYAALTTYYQPLITGAVGCMNFTKIIRTYPIPLVIQPPAGSPNPSSLAPLALCEWWLVAQTLGRSTGDQALFTRLPNAVRIDLTSSKPQEQGAMDELPF